MNEVKFKRERRGRYLSVGWGWTELELGCCHEQRAVAAIIVVQQRRGRALHAAVSGDVTVTWGCFGEAKRHPTVVCAAALLAAHAIGAAAATTVGDSADYQRQLQDQLVRARDVNVDL